MMIVIALYHYRAVWRIHAIRCSRVVDLPLTVSVALRLSSDGDWLVAIT